MQRIVELFLRYKEYATALLLIVISLLAISRSSSSQLRSFRTISVGVIASVQSALSWLPNPYALETENHALRQLNKDLSLQTMQYRDAALKVEKLRAMLGFREHSPMKLLSAEVLGKTTIQERNYATLNVGAKAGVKEGMPVITERGLVGRVTGLNDDYSVVELLLNRDTRVAARTLEGRNDGKITWDGKGSLYLQDIPAAQPQKKGDTVVTSSYSPRYPENIIIGIISDIKEERGSLFYQIRVQPAVNFATLEEAFVVLYSPDQSRLDLERKLIEPNQTGGGEKGR
ncbi:MAG TPA: rod shape-determining protein MreC [Candidatus Kapabacteria bacterium]|nr:rod shape-determining protein MreC [Candidatus Kapabacteria bacterium]